MESKMKTVMIIDKEEEFSNRVQKTFEHDDIIILHCENNRHAINYMTNNEDIDFIDLFLIPIQSTDEKKRFLPCKITDTLSSKIIDNEQLLLEQSPSEKLRTIIKNNLL